MVYIEQQIIKFYQEGLTRPCEIANSIWANMSGDNSFIRDFNKEQLYNKVKYIVRKLKSGKYECSIEMNEPKKEEKKVIVQNHDPSLLNRIDGWGGARKISFGLMGDTQFGSKYAQITYLKHFYNICASRGISDIYHTGDITDGIKMRPGHEYELYKITADELLNDVVKNYPNIDGVTTYFITGNHDASLYKHVGYDIGAAIAEKRNDLIYLGRDCAVVDLTPKCKMELRHPWDGTAYALSYKLQKMVEAMEADSKPNILAVGHYHKAEYLFYRNIHCFQTGCFQSQTPFTRGKGISVYIGGWIITVTVDDDGTILGITPEFIPFYKGITDDYKNYI